MRRYFIFLLFASFTGMAQLAPDTTSGYPVDSNYIYTITEEPAEFPGGITTFFHSFRKCLTYGPIPEACGAGCITFHLKFIIEKDGSMSGISLRSRRCDIPLLEAGCIEVLSCMPPWIPAKLNGRVIRTYYDLPLRIRVN